MANILPFEQQVIAITALTEGASIRSVERMTGIHRDTIMRLGVRVGDHCARFMDEAMHDLPCREIQVDEIWGYVGRKQRAVTPEEAIKGFGDAWTFVALDRETKLVPSFLVGKRDRPNTFCFLMDLSRRLKYRVQLSTDSMPSYLAAVESNFGAEVDYGQVVKTYTMEGPREAQRRYSPAKIVSATRYPLLGSPDLSRVSTSHVERQNLTMRMQIRRLTRLTNAFSRKLENFKAAVALHFAWHNFVKIHTTLRTTPAIAAGVVANVWTVADLVALVRN
jgi:IS1 family transposase